MGSIECYFFFSWSSLILCNVLLSINHEKYDTTLTLLSVISFLSWLLSVAKTRDHRMVLIKFVINGWHCSHILFVASMFLPERAFTQAPLQTATTCCWGPFPLCWAGLAGDMPTVGVKRDLLFKALGRTYSKDIFTTYSSNWLIVCLVIKCPFDSKRQRKSQYCLNSLAWWLATQQLLTSG